MRSVCSLLGHAAAFAVLFAAGCSNSSPEPKGDPHDAVGAPPPPTQTAAYPSGQPHGKAEGETVVREGPLEISKGNPAVTGALLPREAMRKQFGDDWQRLAGRTLRVRGQLYIHRCAPEEQCLTGGEIPRIEPRLMELVETAALDPTSRYLCFDDCDRTDRACKQRAPNSRVLGECTTRLMECRKACGG